MVMGAAGFGHLADRYGRIKVYGMGLLIVLVSILGVVQSSAGFNNSSTSFVAWLSLACPARNRYRSCLRFLCCHHYRVQSNLDFIISFFADVYLDLLQRGYGLE